MNNLISSFKLQEKHIEIFKKYGNELNIKTGEFLFYENDEAKSAYLLLEGELDVLIKDSVDSLRLINKLHPITLFGEMGLFTTGKRTATIRATKNSKIIEIEYKTFLSIASKIPAVNLNMIKELSKRLKECNEKLIENIDYQAKTKTITYIYKVFKERSKIEFEENLENILPIINIEKSELLKTLFFLEKLKVIYQLDLIDNNKLKFNINKNLIEKYFFKFLLGEIK
ncbi:cyclic nucleotide-binding domain-containing protein [Deferribacter thermophilus]|uniref:Crp/Fnr family transcriptional regulator n=1 Tax=Deferribacter thermophilus TaxID=53573 RepID=UPI003C2185FE